MTLMRYEPLAYNNWNALQHLTDEFFNNVNSESKKTVAEDRVNKNSWTPAVDIQEQENNFIIYADIPGVDPSTIEIQMENAVLTINGERDTLGAANKDSFKRQERSTGHFYRRFSLPDSVDVDNIKAKSNNGVLELTIPKSEKIKARRIKIDS